MISNFFKEEGKVDFKGFKVKKIIDKNYNDYSLNSLENLTLRAFEAYIIELE